MAIPQYFMPDPTIPDSELLGYGDLYLDNGERRQVYGDPELTANLPPLPGNDVAEGETRPDTEGMGDTDAGVPGANPADEYQPPGIAPIGGTPHTIDHSTGMITPNGAMANTPEEAMSSMTPQSTEQEQGAKQTPGIAAIPGSSHAIDLAHGTLIPNGASQATQPFPTQQQGGAGYGTGGLQLSEREGALPPDVAEQQRSARETADTNEMLGITTSRQSQYDIYHTAALKSLGEAEGQRQAQEAQLRDQQAKVERLQQEQKLVSDMDIKTDLVSAEGGIGAALSVLGAAMFGAIHSDAGLRMIENTIDRSVKKQMEDKHSKLSILAEQLGSTQQAMAAGKAHLWQILSEKAQATQAVTSADAFQAQTPQILAELQKKNLLENQKFEQLSLGKATEKAPGPGATPAQVEGYGKAANSQQRSEQAALDAALSIGLHWNPETKTVDNKDKVTSIAGFGKADTAAQQLSKLPAIGHIIGAVDTMATSDEGIRNRAAVEKLIIAKMQADNPQMRSPPKELVDEYRKANGLETEQGVKDFIEKSLQDAAVQKAKNEATFGPGAAGTYQQRLNSTGVQQPTTSGQPAQGMQMAQPGQARQQLDQENARGAQGPTSDASGIIKREEGFQSEAYQDETGKWTIGYGHTGPEVKRGMTVNRVEADRLRAKDMDTAEHAVNDSVTAPLEEPQKQALIDLAYNIGPEAFKTSTLVKKLNEGDISGAVAEFDKWNKVRIGGKKQPSDVLTERRKREVQLFEGQG